MELNDIISVITALGAISYGILLWFQWRSSTKVQKADVTEKIGNAYDQLLENMSERIDVLEKKVKKFEIWVPRLLEQIRQLGGIPVDPPDTGELFKAKK